MVIKHDYDTGFDCEERNLFDSLAKVSGANITGLRFVAHNFKGLVLIDLIGT